MKGGKIKMIENTLHNLDVLINNLTDDKVWYNVSRYIRTDECAKYILMREVE